MNEKSCRHAIFSFIELPMARIKNGSHLEKMRLIYSSL